MSIQEAHAGALAGALSLRSGEQFGAPGAGDGPATAIFHPADPAIRLAPSVERDVSGRRMLSGAHVRIDAVADGDAELLLYDLGGSRILPSIDYLPTYGVLGVHFVGMAPGEAYARLLSSLRYINRATHPTAGLRKIELSVLDADGTETPVGRMELTVTDGLPAPTAESVAVGDDIPVGDADTRPDAAALDDADLGPNPFALVVWNAANGVRGDGSAGILGWHRAGEDPRHPLAGRGGPHDEQVVRDNSPFDALVADSGAGTDPPNMDPSNMDLPGDPPIFGDGALHLYGAADLPSVWHGRGLGALSEAGTVEFLGDTAAESTPLVAGGEYRIFSAGANGHDATVWDDPIADRTEPAIGAPAVPLPDRPLPDRPDEAVAALEILKPTDLFDPADTTAGPVRPRDRRRSCGWRGRRPGVPAPRSGGCPSPP